MLTPGNECAHNVYMEATTRNPNPNNLNPAGFGEHIANEALDLIDAVFTDSDDYKSALEAMLHHLNINAQAAS